MAESYFALSREDQREVLEQARAKTDRPTALSCLSALKVLRESRKAPTTPVAVVSPPSLIDSN